LVLCVAGRGCPPLPGRRAEWHPAIIPVMGEFDKIVSPGYNDGNWVKDVRLGLHYATGREYDRTMEISRRTDYGVRVILDLANLQDGERASTQEIAERQRIPAPFLAKIVSQLSTSGLLETYRGAGGGVVLARPPSEINLLDVIEALDGPIHLNRCVIEPDHCPHGGKCPVHDIWMEAQRDLTRVLTSVTFDSLAQQGRETGLLPLPIPPDP